MPRGAKSRMRRTETPKPICINFCVVVDIPDAVKYTNFGDHRCERVIYISDCRQFTDIYISQGRVPTCVRCGRIFVSNLSTSLAVKEFWNRLTFGEVMGKNLVSCFFDSRCTFSLCRSTDTFDCLYAARRAELTSLIIIQEILFSCESVIIQDCLRYAILVWVWHLSVYCSLQNHCLISAEI